MVQLKKLNRTCAARPVARAIPAQIACRVLGNSIKPCHLDQICRPCEKTGVWVFYSAFLVAFCLIFLAAFWFLKITRLYKLTGFVSRLFIPPLKWLTTSFAGLLHFYRNLPF